MACQNVLSFFTSRGGGSPPLDFEFQPVVDEEEPFEDGDRALLEQVRRGVGRVVGHSPQGDVERVLAEGAQAHQHLQVVAHPTLQAAVVVNLAADQDAGL